MSAEHSTVLTAPLSGELVPLERVPDPVFSQKMVGEGIAIDPLDDVLCAPCDGVVIQLHPSGHALTMVTRDGLQILLHVGIDTVKLRGQGFTPKVEQGASVTTGAPLIQFDLDYLSTHAKSLLTLVIVSNPESIASFHPASGMVVVGKDPIFSVVMKSDADFAPAEGPRVTSQAMLIADPLGLHARPSALLASMAKTFKSDIRLHVGEKEANAKSVTSIMGLEAANGAKIMIAAQGPDAADAIKKLSALLRKEPPAGRSDENAPPANSAPAVSARWPRSEDRNLIFGVTASPGVAVGNAFQIRRQEINIVENGGDPQSEHKLLDAAINKAKGQLNALEAQLHGGGDVEKASIFAAHAELVEDPALVEMAASLITKGKSAAYAWKAAFESSAKTLAGMHNMLLVQRADDLRDVGGRVLGLLAGVSPQKQAYPANAVLITEELFPSDTASLDRTKIKGFCTTRGGATSHVAILARSLGIPVLAGTEPRALEISDGTLVILDASRGTLRMNASLAEMEPILQAQKLAEEKYWNDMAKAGEPATTLDGHRIRIGANIDAVQDARRIEPSGGEGIGLLRSEFLFMGRGSAPTEDEQFECYKELAETLGPDRPLNIRTLDIGGDKQLDYLPLPIEDVPFLGERGIRISLDRPDILRTQVRAILRSSAFGKVRILFPMVGRLEELRDAKSILNEEAAALNLEPVPVGIMVEIPATALMAAQFAKEADFFSIGTNDLAQYTLAMDRGHPKLAPHVDGLHPAVLGLIAQSVAGAHSQGKWVSVCGGIAGDAHAVPLLLGLGVDELSMGIPAIPSVKAQVRSLSLSHCKALAESALKAETATEVRALVAEAGLAGIP